MMKILFNLLIFMLLCVCSTHAQSYKSLWKSFDEAIEKDLPKDALSVSSKIVKKAKKEGNFSQLIAARIYSETLKYELSTDSLDNVIKRLEILSNECSGCDRAVASAMLGSAYYSSYMNNNESDKENARNWLLKSVEDMTMLANTESDVYGRLLTDSDKEYSFSDDMLGIMTSFVAKYIDVLSQDEVTDLYERAEKVYESLGKLDEANIMVINKIRVMYSFSLGKNKNNYVECQNLRKKALFDLWQKNKERASGADILNELINVENGGADAVLRLVLEGISLYESSPYINSFKNKRANLTMPMVTMSSDDNILAGVDFDCKFSAKNIDKCHFTITDRVSGKIVSQRDILFNSARYADSIVCDTQKVKLNLPAGKYEFTVKADDKTTKSHASITSLKMFVIGLSDSCRMIVVLDNITGKPVKGAKVVCAKNRKAIEELGDKTIILFTDENGTVVLREKGCRFMKASLSDSDETEIIYSSTPWNGTLTVPEVSYKSKLAKKTSVLSKVYTDRKIYRPGQEVCVAVMAYCQNGDSVSVVPNYEDSITLYDANYKEIGKIGVVTNEYGTANAKFTLPENGLNGNYSVAFGKTRESIIVEEYKRPSFYVEAVNDSLSGEGLSLGDSVTVSFMAKNYSSSSVTNSKVKYTVYSGHTRFFFVHRNNWSTVYSSENVTDENGMSSVKFRLTDEENSDDYDAIRFRVVAEITNSKGETQTGETIFVVLNRDFTMSINSPKMISPQKMSSFEIKAVNYNGKSLDVNGKYEIIKVNKNGKLSDKPLIEGEFATNKPLSITMPSESVCGSYKIKVYAKDSKGRDVNAEDGFVLAKSDCVSEDASEEYVMCEDFLYCEKDTFDNSGPVLVYFIPKESDAVVRYLLTSYDGKVSEGLLKTTNPLKKIAVEWKKEYGDYVTLSIYYVRNGHSYTIQKTIVRPVPDKKLNIRWKTFRDKLMPGQEEKWLLNVTDRNGKAVKAEVLAAMFDASLDKIARHSWNLNLLRRKNIVRPSINYLRANSGIYGTLILPSKTLNESNRIFRQFKVDFSYGGRRTGLMRLGRSGLVMSKSSAAISENAVYTSELMETVSVETDAEYSDGNVDDASSADVVLRENFAETAFFMPHIVTDINGDANIEFTLPQSLTQWRFMAFAHTNDLNYGFIDADIVAQKEFSLSSYIPKFVREGDNVVITSLIENLTDKDVKGKVIMKLTDIRNGKVIMNQTKDFNSVPKTNCNVEFCFAVPEGCPTIVCEITAIGDKFSDGERNYIPVVSRKEKVIEALPFYTDSVGTTTIPVSELFGKESTAVDSRKSITVEYMANPQWAIVEAINTMSITDLRNAMDYSKFMYLNLAAHKMLAAHPEIKSSLESSLKTNYSGLAANGELKYTDLASTPWVSDSECEMLNKQKIIDLYDSTKVHDDISIAEDKLRKLINEDGSLSWFEGMPGSYYITLMACNHLSKMINLLDTEEYAEQSQRYASYYERAMSWADSVTLIRYKSAKEKGNVYVNGYNSSLYLYVSSLKPNRNVGSEIKKMRENMLKSLLSNVKSMSISEKAKLASTLYAFGYEKKAKGIVETILQYTVVKDGMGRYFDTQKAEYSYSDYKIPTQLAAIESIKNSYSGNDKENVLNEMIIWLLRQKQSQLWDNPMTSVNVADLLLRPEYSSEWISNAETPKLMFNGKEIKIDETVAGAGYFKVVINSGFNDDGNDNLQIEKQSKGMSWGAVYAEKTLDVSNDTVSARKDEVSIGFTLYKQIKGTDSKPQWREISENEKLNVGDKLRMRVSVKSDRDVDFMEVIFPLAACTSLNRQLSGYYNCGGGRYCYLAIHDSALNLFIDKFEKGSMTVDFEANVTNAGTYSTGFVKAQSVYNASMTSYVASHNITVEK